MSVKDHLPLFCRIGIRNVDNFSIDRKYFINLVWLSIAAFIGAYLGEIVVITAGVWNSDWFRPVLVVGFTCLPYLLILSAAKMNKITLPIVCILVSISYFMAQYYYAYSWSSTASLVYLAFYFYGAPIALLWVLISWSFIYRRSSRDS